MGLAKSAGEPEFYEEDDEGESELVTPGDDDATRLRRVWISAVRRFHEAQTGQPSRYNSSVQWDGGVQRSTNRRLKPVWPTLAAKCRAQGFDPADLVDVLFAAWESDSAPTPHMLAAPANVDRYRASLARRRRKIFLALAAEESAWRAAVWGARQGEPDPEAAVRFVINDLGVSVSPAFRYAMAAAAGLAPEAARWRQVAVYQVRRDLPHYREFWSRLLPKELLDAAQSAEVV